MTPQRIVDLVIVGGGPAGLAAALEARRQGLQDILLIERDPKLGGILNQCIHPGFGLHYFQTELTGPEYAARFVADFTAAQIPALLEAHVTSISPDKVLTVVQASGLLEIKARAIILAMGCRERPRGALGIPGTRCSGIWTAGTAQRLLNLEGLLPGRTAVILGSGDIGLIMARRLTLEGIRVEAVVELMPYSSGLTRNVVQCLQDYDIPLLLSHTVTEIHGRERLTGVTICPVHPQTRQPDLSLPRFIACDTLLLSVGLIPENELSREAGLLIDPATRGPRVDQQLASSLPGVFACGNVLKVHDLVDEVSLEAEHAARSAVDYLHASSAQDSSLRLKTLPIERGPGVRSLTPQLLNADDDSESSLTLQGRTDAVYRGASLCLRDALGVLIFSAKRKILTPGELFSLTIPKNKTEPLKSAAALRLSVEYLQTSSAEQSDAPQKIAGESSSLTAAASFVCISCPVGCSLSVSQDPQGRLVVTGHQCARGEIYARAEFSQPQRMLTTLVAVEGCRTPLSVRTSEPIPKEKLQNALAVIHQLKVTLPVLAGQVLITGLLGTNADVIATRDLSKKMNNSFKNDENPGC